MKINGFFSGLFLLSVCIFSPVMAQQQERMRAYIDTLCAPLFHGRGYMLEGDRKAADWISNTFEQIGLKSFGQTYAQKFSLPVLTFTENPTLQLGRKKLKPGTDFIPDPASAAGAGKLELLALDTLLFESEAVRQAWLGKDLSKSALWLEQSWEKSLYQLPRSLLRHLLRAPLLIIVQQNLVFGIADDVRRPPTLRVRESVFRTAVKRGRKVRFSIQNKRQAGYQSQNVIAYVPGTAQPERFVVFSAHYDHLGGWGEDVYFPGANDNASGTAFLLELARHYAQNPARQSVAFMAFSGEEAGLKGSRFYVDNPLFSLDSIDFLFNLDLIGTGETGATLVNGSVYKDTFDALKALNKEKGYLPDIWPRGAAANSDHHFFHLKGVPSFFIYLTTEHPEKLGYHSPDDTPEKLSLAGMPGLFRLLTDFVRQMPTRTKTN